MLTINLRKIERFYFIFAITFCLLAILVIFTLKGIFSSIITTLELNEEEIKSIPLVNEFDLNKAYDETINKKIEPLDLSE